MPRVTVITPVYNSAAYLPQTVASIQAQTYRDFEHIIVDDASTDGTPAILAHAARDPRIRLIRRDENGGPFVAANEGLRAASGEIVVCTDADDVSLPTRIERQIAFLDEHPEIEACVTLTRALDDSRPVLRIPSTSGSIRWGLCLGCILVHSSLAIRRAAFERRGYYRPLPLAQDYRLFCELARDGALSVLPELHVLFRRAPTRVSTLRARELGQYTRSVLTEHMQLLDPGTWGEAEIETLYAIAQSRRQSVVPALRALARWEHCWREDPSLTEREIKELASLLALKKRSFLRRNGTVSPMKVLRRVAGCRPRRHSHAARSVAQRAAGLRRAKVRRSS